MSTQTVELLSFGSRSHRRRHQAHPHLPKSYSGHHARRRQARFQGCFGGFNGTTTTLTSSAATGNQFFLNGAAIAGATGQTYVIAGTPAQLGAYTVVTTTSQGCASLPSTALVVTSNAKLLAGSTLRMYPNPTPDGRFNVELAGYRKTVELSVFNALGQRVHSATVKVGAGTTTQPFDLTPLLPGVYVLRAKTEGGLDTRQIVKQ